jgi:hypothetical protein
MVREEGGSACDYCGHRTDLNLNSPYQEWLDGGWDWTLCDTPDIDICGECQGGKTYLDFVSVFGSRR